MFAIDIASADVGILGFAPVPGSTWLCGFALRATINPGDDDDDDDDPKRGNIDPDDDDDVADDEEDDDDEEPLWAASA
jgi:hypothetical protein